MPHIFLNIEHDETELIIEPIGSCFKLSKDDIVKIEWPENVTEAPNFYFLKKKEIMFWQSDFYQRVFINSQCVLECWP